MMHLWMVIFTIMNVSKTGTTYSYYPADIAGAAFYHSKAECEIFRPSFDKQERINASETTKKMLRAGFNEQYVVVKSECLQITFKPSSQ